MIFLTVGTEKYPFDRVVEEVDRLAGLGLLGGEELFVQTGSCTYEPKHGKSQERLSYGEMVETVREARLVIAHGGAGSFMLCRQFGTPLIAVPRLHRLQENLDDHQVLFCQRLAEQGLLTAVEDMKDMEGAVAAALAGDGQSSNDRERTRLIEALRETTSQWGLV